MDGIRFPALVGSLTEVVRYVHELGGSAGLSDRRVDRLRLAAEEFVTNIVIHGYAERGAEVGTIEMRGGVEPDRVWLLVIDGAPRFDPTSAAVPADLDRPLSERQPGGLGLFLACSVLDGLTYRYHDGKNELTMMLHRLGAEEDGACVRDDVGDQ